MDDELHIGKRSRNIILLLQSMYYLATALWPLIDIDSFMQISGYKNDTWLVKTVSVLILCIGLALIADIPRKAKSFSTVVLAISSGLGLLCVDLFYSLSNVISDIYLADAALQLVFVLLWVFWLLRYKIL